MNLISKSALPPIFIEMSSQCGGLAVYTLDDAVEHPEGRYVRLADYLELKTRCESAIRFAEQLEVLKKAGVTELKLL